MVVKPKYLLNTETKALQTKLNPLLKQINFVCTYS